MFDVFLSFKNHTDNGSHTKDREMAQELYDELTHSGISVFFSEETLGELGVAQYKTAIDSALDWARVLVAVGTSADNLSSNWVRYEWDSFFSDILSEGKDAKLFSYIDGMTTGELPRTLRQNQVFEARDFNVKDIAEYIKAALGFGAKGSNSKSATMPNRTRFKERMLYSYDDDGEAERLRSQAGLVLENDKAILGEMLKGFEQGVQIHVLDVGCSDGYLTEQLFSELDGRIRGVIGVDCQNVCIDNAANRGNEIFEFHCLDVEADDFEKSIRAVMSERKIESFDIIFTALTLHHLNDPKGALRKLRKLLSDDGFLYARSCDDDEILGYPDPQGIIRHVLDETQSVERVSDRMHGRKMYEELYKSGFKHIEMRNYYVTTAGMTIDERCDFFYDIFHWRKNRFNKWIEVGPDAQAALDKYTQICEELDAIEELFYDPSFYFCVAGPIAIGRK